ncbi:MAG TPA: 23S rRNA (uracil(1939)-C(5))-methyltransferase RlmD [Steroidobacteraceae bacterium]|nr:23S rRNA (uracil(1939)-C(5))-methyltransferase RlmD [Steroidobacteraceae bacterium]
MHAQRAPSDAPLEEEAVVSGITHEGEGIVKEGKTAFVAGALPGERIRFRRTKRHRQHDDAQLLEVLEPARERVQPRCAHFGVCGGCALQHLAPEAQLAAKQLELKDNFERVARVMPDEWLEPLRGPVWNYRRRARLGAKYVAKKGRVVVGFRERLSPYVAALDRCEVLAAPADALIEPLSQMLTASSIRERLPQIEVAVADNATALVFRVLEPPSPDDLAKFRAFERDHGVRIYLQPGGLDSVRRLAPDAEPSPPAESPLTYALPAFAVTLEFAPTDFIQINRAINEALVARAVDLLAVDLRSRVLDLFCGLGNFTLPLARRAAHAVGIEGDRELVKRAAANARRNGIANAEFHVADLAKATDDTPATAPAWAKEGYTHILLDPPRAGAREMLPTVARLAPKRVLYISCHPGSLARDTGMLVHQFGFRLRAAGVLDMFPHTTHVESLALFEPAPSRS